MWRDSSQLWQTSSPTLPGAVHLSDPLFVTMGLWGWACLAPGHGSLPQLPPTSKLSEDLSTG